MGAFRVPLSALSQQEYLNELQGKSCSPPGYRLLDGLFITPLQRNSGANLRFRRPHAHMYWTKLSQSINLHSHRLVHFYSGAILAATPRSAARIHARSPSHVSECPQLRWPTCRLSLGHTSHLRDSRTKILFSEACDNDKHTPMKTRCLLDYHKECFS